MALLEPVSRGAKLVAGVRAIAFKPSDPRKTLPFSIHDGFG